MSRVNKKGGNKFQCKATLLISFKCKSKWLKKHKAQEVQYFITSAISLVQQSWASEPIASIICKFLITQAGDKRLIKDKCLPDSFKTQRITTETIWIVIQYRHFIILGKQNDTHCCIFYRLDRSKRKVRRNTLKIYLYICSNNYRSGLALLTYNRLMTMK